MTRPDAQRAEAVEQHVDPDTGATPLGQRLRHVAGHRTVLVEVLGVVDRGLGQWMAFTRAGKISSPF